MNVTERRLKAVEERLESFEASEPPEGLLESLQTEIPEDLGRSGGDSSRVSGSRYLKLAASLAVVAIGGALGYRMLQDGPTPGDLVSTPAAIPEVETQPDPIKAELGEAQEPEVVAGQELAASGAVGSTEGHRQSDLDDSAEALASSSRTEKSREKDLEALRMRQETPRDELKSPLSSLESRDANELPKPVAEVAPAPAPVLVEESIVVTGERPPLDIVSLQSGTTVKRSEAQKSPSAADGRQQRRIAPPMSPPAESDEASSDLMAVEETITVAPRRSFWKLWKRKAPAIAAPPHTSPSTGGTHEPNDQPYGDMFFHGYGTNPFVDTEDDAQSTFGIDVDTASYTMARSYLQRGHLPPGDAIRVEEFVNYFDYRDQAPRSKDFAAVVEGAPSPFASTARTHLLRFAIKGREVSEAQRKAAVLTFVIDVSGSMNRENRLGLVKQALRLLVGELNEDDAIGVVIYGNQGHVILQPTRDHHRVMAAIDRLNSGGSTNAEEGLVLGYEMARRYFLEGGINRVILCSDGVANVGATGPDSILARIGREADRGIELTTVGFGMGNYNDVLMEQLADKGDGNYAYVDDLPAAQRVFVENLTGTLQTIAGDAKIQVEFEPSMVQSYRLLGYENRDIADRDFRNDAIDAGEIGAGHAVTALYEVKLKDDAPRRGKVATLRLRYRSKRSERVVEDSVALDRSDLASKWGGASHGLRLAAVAAEFSEVLRRSFWARDADLRWLASEARHLAGERGGDRDVSELAGLIETAAQLFDGQPAGVGGDGFEER